MINFNDVLTLKDTESQTEPMELFSSEILNEFLYKYSTCGDVGKGEDKTEVYNKILI